MQNQFYSVHLSLSDGHSSISLGYAVKINSSEPMDAQQLESNLLERVAAEHGFNYNGEYYETVGQCGISLSRVEAISEHDFSIISKVFNSLAIDTN